MTHYISERIENDCGCELLADGVSVPAHWIHFRIDTHSGDCSISTELGSPIPANVVKLEARLLRHQIPFGVTILPDSRPLQYPRQHYMKLIDQKDARILLEHLLSHADRLRKLLPEK